MNKKIYPSRQINLKEQSMAAKLNVVVSGVHIVLKSTLFSGG